MKDELTLLNLLYRIQMEKRCVLGIRIVQNKHKVYWFTACNVSYFEFCLTLSHATLKVDIHSKGHCL